MLDKNITENIEVTMAEIGQKARLASKALAISSHELRQNALRKAAKILRARASEILAANVKDMAFAKEKNIADAMLDRLLLTPARIQAMPTGLEAIADLQDPVGQVMAAWGRPNGLHIQRVAVPLGVIGIIYESRPNVTADAGGLCIKSGNAAILRCGSESFHSSSEIASALREGLSQAGLNPDALQMVPTRNREAIGTLLKMHHDVDVIIPRGGHGLNARVMAEARMPVFAHLDGLCHVFIDQAADIKKAIEVTLNAKMRRTGICGAAETLLVHRAIAAQILPDLGAALAAMNCEIRGDVETCALIKTARPADEKDWSCEYLDAIISIKVVDSLSAAITHINQYGSHHTDCIMTEDQEIAAEFLQKVDSAICIHNASTQFADGGEFGLGAEIGISTGRIHARGPIGAAQLTSFKYKVLGNGQTRP